MKTTITNTNSWNTVGGLATLLLLFASVSLGWTQTTNVWTDNFESPTVWDNWNVDNGVWEIGQPLTGPPVVNGYRTHEGTNCAATVLNGNYPASTSSRLIRTLPFVVPSASQNPRLQFWHWYQFSGNSYGVVQIKYGTNPWTDLSPRYYATGSGVWTRPVVDLSAYAGKAVQIAFQIAADGNVADGWDVDQVSVIKGPYTVGFTNGATENFESGLGDWYAETGIWQVGVPTSGPGAAHSGTNCLATVLGGNYADNCSSRFISPAFVVPPTNDMPRLRFWHWWSFSLGDSGQVQISTNNGASWQALSPSYGEAGCNCNYGSSARWTRAWLDLTPFADRTVRLAFYFFASSGYENSGWYVDDLLVETGPLPQFATVDGFEDAGALDRWTADHGVWEIGKPTSGPGGAHGGTNCLATLLTGNYYDNTWSRISSPAFVVPPTNDMPRLRFWHWWSFSLGDSGQVQISTNNGASWQALSPSYGEAGCNCNYGSSARWTRAWLDLTPFADRTVRLAFYFFASSGYENSGWYVDDLLVETGPLPQFATVDGFEDAGALDRWTADHGVWEIGKPTSGPGGAHGGTNCLATLLTGNYYDNTWSRISSPAFVVPPTNDMPRLRFWHWWSFSLGDSGQVQISTNNGASWQALSPSYGEAGCNCNYGSSARWTRAWLDLTPFADRTVRLAFYFSASSGYENPGWYVDDLLVETGPLPQFATVDGFEDAGALDRWTADHGVWEIGKPTSGPGGAHGGTNCLATLLTGNYYDNTWSRISSPAFVVPPVGEHPILHFWHWWSFNLGDSGQVQIKIGTSDWINLVGFSGSGGGVWTRPAIDLSPYSGQSVRLGFYFSSSSGYENPGWYIDDITLTTTAPPSGIVEFTDARYFINEGETNATITVERKYGGAGAVNVTFVATDGTAVGGVDFDSVVDTISWADGEQGLKTDVVPIHLACSPRGNKTVTLQLAVPGSVASSVARENATLVILDNCLPPLSTTTNIAYLRSLVGTTNWVPTNTTTLFTVEGTVTFTNSTEADDWFLMQDGVYGIEVFFRGGTNQFTPQPGDRLRVTATLTNLNGMLALVPDYANLTNVVWRVSSSNALPTPAPLNFADKANVPVMEATEARYVIATDVMISQSGGAYFPTLLTDLLMTNQAGQTFSLSIYPNLTNAGQLKPTGPVTVLGVLWQNDPTSPYTTNYSLLPTEIQGGNPGVIQFVETSYAVLESAPSVTLAVSRTGANNGPVSVTFATVNGVAIAATDYVATNGVLSWADGESGIKTITFQILNDAVEEPDEVFTVGLSGVALGANTTAQVMIVNDDFVVQPAYVALPAGSNTVFSVTPTASTVGFQWWKNGVAKSNATNATLTVANVQTNDSGNYWVVVTTTLGTVTSSTGQLVVAIPVTISSQPQSQTVTAGSYVSLCVGGSGTQPFTYQWLRNGGVLGGATNACLVLLSAQTTDTANYSVVVNNPANQPVVSSSAALTVFGGGFVPAGAGLGSYTTSNGCYSVSGGGEDIEGTEDRFFFVSTSLAGNGQIIAHLGDMRPDNSLSEAGIMLRDGFAGGDRHVFLALNADNRTVFRRRQVANYTSVQNWYHGTNSAWLHLARMGDTFIGHYSTNGINWELVWWTTMTNMPANLQAGLAVTAHRNDGTNTATFCSVSVGGLMPLSGPWPEAGPRFYTGGESGGLAEFQRVGGFKFLVGGVVGDQFSIMYSANPAASLASWASLGTVTNQYGVVPFLDPQALSNTKRFYRAQRTGP